MPVWRDGGLDALRARGQHVMAKAQEARLRAAAARELARKAARNRAGATGKMAEVRSCLTELCETESSLEKALDEVRRERARVAGLLGRSAPPTKGDPGRILRFRRS